MATIEVKMPKLGESVIEATVLKWNKQPGEHIAQDETLLEIATDKVDSEVPAPVSGMVGKLLAQVGDVVAIGTLIATIETEAAAAAVAQPEVPYLPAAASDAAPGGERFYSPLVLNIARAEGVGMAELERIAGTGKDGRVTKADMLAYVAQRSAAPTPEVASAPVVAAPPAPPKPAAQAHVVAEKTFNHGTNYDLVEMDRMRKIIAENMVYSKHVSAHVTSFVEADVTNLVLWRNKVKNAFEKQHGQKLTFTPIFIEAVAKALRKFPMVNASVQGTQILVKKDVNIGVAVALPTDNLIVPVIKQADRLNLVGLAASLNDLAERARANKLRPDELEGGTYSVSNVGTFGNVMGTPVILQPQVAILATGAIRKLPAVVETPTGDVIAIRHKMFLSHSYDHRIIDGALGGKFVRYVADLLEAWDLDAAI